MRYDEAEDIVDAILSNNKDVRKEIIDFIYNFCREDEDHIIRLETLVGVKEDEIYDLEEEIEELEETIVDHKETISVIKKQRDDLLNRIAILESKMN